MLNKLRNLAFEQGLFFRTCFLRSVWEKSRLYLYLEKDCSQSSNRKTRCLHLKSVKKKLQTFVSSQVCRILILETFGQKFKGYV